MVRNAADQPALIKPRANDRFTMRLEGPGPERQLGSRLYQLDVLRTTTPQGRL